jgi:hypothetical protein
MVRAAQVLIRTRLSPTAATGIAEDRSDSIEEAPLKSPLLARSYGLEPIAL